MTTKILIGITLTLVVGYGLHLLWMNYTPFNWGHHFTFENELGIDVDSLEIVVGHEKTMIRESTNSIGLLEGNINVPKKNYPHKVTITIYSNGDDLTLKADSFDCYNCDGSHEYILRKAGAKYKFYN